MYLENATITTNCKAGRVVIVRLRLRPTMKNPNRSPVGAQAHPLFLSCYICFAWELCCVWSDVQSWNVKSYNSCSSWGEEGEVNLIRKILWKYLPRLAHPLYLLLGLEIDSIEASISACLFTRVTLAAYEGIRSVCWWLVLCRQGVSTAQCKVADSLVYAGWFLNGASYHADAHVIWYEVQ